MVDIIGVIMLNTGKNI